MRITLHLVEDLEDLEVVGLGGLRWKEVIITWGKIPVTRCKGEKRGESSIGDSVTGCGSYCWMAKRTQPFPNPV
jgi:hypothetical protein